MDKTNKDGDYDNTTEIGLYALSWLAAYDLGLEPNWGPVHAEVYEVLYRLRQWQTGAQVQQPYGPNAYQNSVFFQYYWIFSDPPTVGRNDEGSHNQLVPSIDNAWLAACLMTIQAYALDHNQADLADLSAAILKDMNFMLWYHPTEHLFAWGADHDPTGGPAPWWADTYSDENRMINFVARVLGQMSPGEFQASLAAMHQEPGTYSGIQVDRVNWDGSYFTYTAPALFLHEMATGYAAHTILPATQAQIAFAHNKGYQAWGFSDCYALDGTYVQSGAPPSRNPTTEQTPGLVAPFASGLALNTPYRATAEAQLKALPTQFPCVYDWEGPYGFRDSVMAWKQGPDDPQFGRCSPKFSALGQEWMFLSIANLKTRFVWKYFYAYPGVLQTHCEMFGCTVRHNYLPMGMR